MLFKNLGFTAYNEGWGLYAEQLGDELGMYDDYPAGKIGYLQSFLYRAARIVLDTGIHAKGWSREQAVTYMLETVGLPRGAAENEIDRLRSRAKTILGSRFDLKGFHDVVLLGGAVPLTVLEQVVDQWAAARRS